MHEDQTSMFLKNEFRPTKRFLQLPNIIFDRGSRYSVTAGVVKSDKNISEFLKHVKQNKKYAKATHNSYAARYIVNGMVIDRKSDDGETGAGMVILRRLHKQNVVNVIVVVTRWFGGTKLHADRFKHVQDATIEILKALKCR